VDPSDNILSQGLACDLWTLGTMQWCWLVIRESSSWDC